MRKLLITSLVLTGVSATVLPPALAEKTSIEVTVPANVADPATAEAYKAELKQAIKKARRGSEDQQRRAADILRRAAAEVDGLGDDEVDI